MPDPKRHIQTVDTCSAHRAPFRFATETARAGAPSRHLLHPSSAKRSRSVRAHGAIARSKEPGRAKKLARDRREGGQSQGTRTFPAFPRMPPLPLLATQAEALYDLFVSGGVLALEIIEQPP